MSDVVIGNGIIGSALFTLLSQVKTVCCLDIDKSKCVGEVSGSVDVLHFCFPYSKDFVSLVVNYAKRFNFKELVIHSTVKPGTTLKIQGLLAGPVVYSPVRGVHSRMAEDLRRYTKFFASLFDAKYFVDEMNSLDIKVERFGSSTSLELAKVLMGTTYYGWLIMFAQRVKLLAANYGVDESELWRWTEEIHAFLGNRPKMFSGDGIGGHCVLPNLRLLDDCYFNLISGHDELFRSQKK